MKNPTCFKGSPSCIDLIITDRKAYFKKKCILETGISDFHKLTKVSLKSQILKLLQTESYTEIIQRLMKITSIML